jgi:hypothetical protein
LADAFLLDAGAIVAAPIRILVSDDRLFPLAAIGVERDADPDADSDLGGGGGDCSSASRSVLEVASSTMAMELEKLK